MRADVHRFSLSDSQRCFRAAPCAGPRNDRPHHHRRRHRQDPWQWPRQRLYPRLPHALPVAADRRAARRERGGRAGAHSLRLLRWCRGRAIAALHGLYRHPGGRAVNGRLARHRRCLHGADARRRYRAAGADRRGRRGGQPRSPAGRHRGGGCAFRPGQRPGLTLAEILEDQRPAAPSPRTTPAS